MTQNKKGFTLIELLVVIAIIGLLSTLAVIALNNARAKSRDAKRVADVKQIQSALELYYNDANGYPATADVVIDGATALKFGTTEYMKIVPKAPEPPVGNVYTYANATSYTDYTLQYTLETGAGGISSGLHTASSRGIQ